MEAYQHAIACAERGDVDFFKTVAPEILLKFQDCINVLSVAALEGHLDCCEVIVERCPQLLYHQDRIDKWSVLHWVAAFNCDNNLENIMRFLLFTADSKPDLELGGGPKIPNYRLLTMQDFRGRTALHLAVFDRNHGATKLLLEADRDFRLRRMVNDDGNTCLHSAVMSDDQDMVKLICEADPDKQLLSMPDERNNTLLHLAVRKSNLEMVKLICEADLDKQLLSMPAKYNDTPLHWAVRYCEVEIVKLLIQMDNVTVYCAVNNDNQTPLSMAMDGSGSDSEVICKVLLENDWTKVVDFHGQNAVHVAAYHGHLAVVQHFLQSKEDTDVVALFNSQDEEGNTPLHLAVSNGHVQVLRLLLEAPQISDHKATNISKQTPYMMAMGKILSDGYGECSDSDSEIIRMLLGKDPEQCKLRTGDMRQTYLHLATSCGHLSIIKDIIKLCPDCPKIEDTHKQTFIHIAAKHGFVNVAKFILESKEIENTILNAQDKDGNTPLHIAALNKSQKAALCLLYDARVDKGIENDKREKAIDLIDFPYDEAKARVYSLGHQRDLKDQSSFDLLVATLIATVSFAAGITLPGGYISDGVNKGSAILWKATSFKVFIVSNNFALLFSLYTVFLNFSTRRLLKEEDIYYESSMGTFRTRLLLKKKDMIYQLNAATLCTLSAVYAMVVAFITGSYAVLANSDGLAITVCVSSCFFLILASHATWTMAMQYWRSKPVPKVSS